MDETSSFYFDTVSVEPAVCTTMFQFMAVLVLVVHRVKKSEVGLDPLPPSYTRPFLMPSVLVCSDEEAHGGRPG